MSYVLLVEDSPADVELALAGFEPPPGFPPIVVSPDGADALKRLLGSGAEDSISRPALIVLDLKLPKLGGFEVLRTVRETAALANVPVVIVTGSREERDLVEGWKLGVNAFLEKPIDLGRINALFELA